MATKEGVLKLPKRNKAPQGEAKCGSCKWLDTPHTGKKTCRSHFGASEETEICADYTKIDPKQLASVDSLKNDPVVVEYLETLKDPRLQIDETLQDELVAIKDELKQIKKKDKGVPLYYREEEDAEKLVSVFSEIQGHRDRVMAIYLELAPVERRLQKLWDQCEMYLSSFPIVSEQSTEGKRNKILGAILEPLHDRLSTVKAIMKLSDRVDSYLNSTHFMVKEVKDIGVKVLELRKASKFRP